MSGGERRGTLGKKEGTKWGKKLGSDVRLTRVDAVEGFT